MLNDLDLYEEKKQELNETKDVEETLLERINIYLKSKTLYLMFLWCIIVFILFVVVLINLTESKNNINILTKIIIVFITFYMLKFTRIFINIFDLYDISKEILYIL